MRWASEFRVDVKQDGVKNGFIQRVPGKNYHLKCAGCGKISTFPVGTEQPKACPKCGRK